MNLLVRLQALSLCMYAPRFGVASETLHHRIRLKATGRERHLRGGLGDTLDVWKDVQR